MDARGFSKSEAIRFGWEATKNNLLFFIVFFIVTLAISGGISSLQYPRLRPEHALYHFLIGVLEMVVSIFLTLAYTKVALRLSAEPGANFEISDAWSGYPHFLAMLVGSVLYALIVLAGLILLIVPGIIWGIKYSLFTYLILDRGMGPIEALKRSGEITMGHKGNLFLLHLLFVAIALLGALACGVGILVAAPIILIAHAYVYRRLEYGAAPAEPASP